jgi:triacylglycerol lipase
MSVMQRVGDGLESSTLRGMCWLQSIIGGPPVFDRTSPQTGYGTGAPGVIDPPYLLLRCEPGILKHRHACWLLAERTLAYAIAFFMRTYPPDFDKNRAAELGKLVDAAYTQYNQRASGSNAWEPDGYQVHAILQAKEVEFPVPFGFVATKGTDAYVVIRGTLTPLEWFDDATVVPVPFALNWGHTTQGFKVVYSQLSATIIQAINQLKSAGAFVDLYVTGHSLGAALAHLAAADIFAQSQTSAISYTLAGPRTGDPVFAAAFVQAGLKTWRIFNTEDIVPTLPLSTPDLIPANLGLDETPGEMLLKLFLHHSAVNRGGWLYEHLEVPIAVTFQKGSIADNHNCTNLYTAL